MHALLQPHQLSPKKQRQQEKTQSAAQQLGPSGSEEGPEEGEQAPPSSQRKRSRGQMEQIGPEGRSYAAEKQASGSQQPAGSSNGAAAGQQGPTQQQQQQAGSPNGTGPQPSDGSAASRRSPSTCHLNRSSSSSSESHRWHPQCGLRVQLSQVAASSLLRPAWVAH